MLLPLLWKDIRLNKYVMLLTVFLVDTPYVTTAFGLSAFTGDPENADRPDGTADDRLSVQLVFCGAGFGLYRRQSDRGRKGGADRSVFGLLAAHAPAGRHQQISDRPEPAGLGLDRAADRLFRLGARRGPSAR